ncbi:methyltransferase [Kitasatospora sp. NPDC058965]|uniref:methyltransferase n=1 Tax=Kitasatospora sp. NPDC058965 TaxID=3346682 RepID=UPI0036A9E26D
MINEAGIGVAAAEFERIDRAVGFIRSHGTEEILATLLPELPPHARAAFATHCRFSHAAVLVFPPSLAALHAGLRDRGLDVGEFTPSVVVRARLAARYRRPAAELEVGILRAPVRAGDRDDCEVEIFALAVPPGSELVAIAEAERVAEHEAHLAFEVRDPDPVVLGGLRALLLDPATGLVADGGGYTAHEDATVLYFQAESASTAGRRLELYVRGRHDQALRDQLADTRLSLAAPAGDEDPAETLLRLMTGAWATQAIGVAAELRLADHLADGPAELPALAAATGTDPASLARLLRYLGTLGLLTESGSGYGLTPVGALLGEQAEHSMRPLALLYRGPFYDSFGALGHAVRTGRPGFDHLFGAHHFEHFARDPELAELFDRAMAASSAMFAPIPALLGLTGPATVVDVAGGNGELLSRILSAAPGARGVLLERPHAVEAARKTMANAGCLDRCELLTGDFTRAVPEGGDHYLLSRVLHDWDDEQCRAILGRLAEAMPAHAELLIVERLLPQQPDAASLAVPWDVHMLCNVGGRERTAGHYAELLAQAGFVLTDRHRLPLDAVLLRARPARPARSARTAR